ncbi:hypothetical protein SP15_081 [Bacillus phage SP-15]|uniref:Uncharacterized protein n=1 Tax=Bacillus phage SP-15 TaxID=1792032 RepID=A0A127AW68_9CAUD|nr:hypothetical protein SP15_081 [Bacillus phage SP-15]AMM44880.1 hypothetical protein SP15_081 [Bacillus phage SP-15]
MSSLESTIYDSGKVAQVSQHSPELGTVKRLITLPRILAQAVVSDFDIYMQREGYQFTKHEVSIFELVRTANSTQLMTIAEIFPAVVFAYLEWSGLSHPDLEFKVVEGNSFEVSSIDVQ